MDNEFTQRRQEDYERAVAFSTDFSAREWCNRLVLLHYQRKQLDTLARHAIERSSFYRDLYKSIRTDRPIHLEDLPVINKKNIMENFDRIITDPRLKLDEIHDYIDHLTHDDYYRGEYRILTSSGTTGFRGIFVYDRKAWSTILAAVNRAASLMGVSPSIRLKIASIGANTPLHLSYRRATSMDFGLHDYKRLDAKESIDVLVNTLNAFQPEYLHTYASIASLLACEQLEGRLRIKPSIIVSSAELLTEKMKKQIKQAWNVIPFNSYSTTEGLLAIECTHHTGIHLFEDLCIVEVVDENNQPVPDDSPGHKILFTNLYQYTQPIIRYEISDMMTVAANRCPCGRPFRRIIAMEGRNDDMLHLSGMNGTPVSIPPYFFHSAMATLSDVIEYQVVQRKKEIIFKIVLRREARPEEAAAKVKERITKEFTSYRVICPDIRLRIVDRIERDPEKMGKVKLVKREL